MPATSSRNANRLLWTVQILLACLFLMSGTVKLVLPLEALKGPIALPGLFVRFIGIAEVSGAVGLVLPGLVHRYQHLTWLAAAGLTLIMTGATVLTAISMGALPSLFPFFVGLAATSIVYARRIRFHARAR